MKRKYTSTYPALTMVKKAKTETKKLHSDADVKKLLAKMLRMRGLSPEVKFFTTIVTGVTPSNTTGTLQSLVLVAQGTDEVNRIGDRIRIKKVVIKGFINSAASSDQGFLCLLCDKQPNGAQVNMCADFNTTAVTPYNASSTVAPFAATPLRNMNAQKRYSYYRESMWGGNQQITGGLYNPMEKCFNFSKEFTTPLEVEYSNTTGAITSVSTNNLCFGWSDSAGVNTAISFYAQIHFTDA